MATVLDQVRTLIERLALQPDFDDCITDLLSLSVRQHANHKTRELVGSPRFERCKDSYSLCGLIKLVISKQPR